MIKLKPLIESTNDIKWIIGYVDSYGHVNHHVVYDGDELDSHSQIWPDKVAAHGKWRWWPHEPNKINNYNEDLDEESIDRIWDIVDNYRI